MFRLIFRLRFEELLGLVFFIPMTYLTLRFAGETGFTRGNIERFFGLLVMILVFLAVLKRHRALQLIRDFIPIACCVVIYLNLHDLIHFVNRVDKDATLAAIDLWLLGEHASITLQHVINPWLTDFTTVCYSLFYFYPVVLAVMLYFSHEYKRFRRLLVSVLLCFYVGYFGYIIVPAVGPQYILADQYTTDLSGSLYSAKLRQTINVLEVTRRDCFPSLHNGVTLLTWLFFILYRRNLALWLLPFVAGLMFGTIYLRYHWFIDQLAGWALALVCFWAGPRLSDFWDRKMAEAESGSNPIGAGLY